MDLQIRQAKISSQYNIWTSVLLSQLDIQFIFHGFPDIQLQAVNLLISEWTFHGPIGYSVAMTCHAFLAGEIINELYLQTIFFHRTTFQRTSKFHYMTKLLIVD